MQQSVPKKKEQSKQKDARIIILNRMFNSLKRNKSRKGSSYLIEKNITSFYGDIL